MNVKHVVEKEDGTVVFQGSLEGQELAFVIEMGLDAIIQAGALPFVSTKQRSIADIHQVPDETQ